jgi:hypothetical protein
MYNHKPSSPMISSVNWSDVVRNGIDHWISKNQPVIIENIDHSFIPATWTLEGIVSQFGDTKLRILRSRSQYFKFDDKKEREIVELSLREFYEKGVLNIGTDGFFYALGRSPIDQFNGLKELMALPHSLARIVDGTLRRPERNLWISPKGTRTALHFDAVENLNLQVQGSKSFLLYPPRVDDMHCYPLNSQAAYVSSIDPRDDVHPDSSFPYSSGIEVVLHAGQMIYLPYGWWHQIDTTGELNMNANYWWFPRLKLLTYPNQTLRGMAVLAHRKGSHPHKRAQKMAASK